jgi:hypothetical protein
MLPAESQLAATNIVCSIATPSPVEVTCSTSEGRSRVMRHLAQRQQSASTVTSSRSMRSTAGSSRKASRTPCSVDSRAVPACTRSWRQRAAWSSWPAPLSVHAIGSNCDTAGRVNPESALGPATRADYARCTHTHQPWTYLPLLPQQGSGLHRAGRAGSPWWRGSNREGAHRRGQAARVLVARTWMGRSPSRACDVLSIEASYTRA